MVQRRRPVRVATISHRPTAGTDTPEGTARLLQEAERYLERAARMGADLVAFTEIYPQLALADPFHHAEPSGGGTLDRIRELAQAAQDDHRLAPARVRPDPEDSQHVDPGGPRRGSDRPLRQDVPDDPRDGERRYPRHGCAGLRDRSRPGRAPHLLRSELPRSPRGAEGEQARPRRLLVDVPRRIAGPGPGVRAAVVRGDVDRQRAWSDHRPCRSDHQGINLRGPGRCAHQHQQRGHAHGFQLDQDGCHAGEVRPCADISTITPERPSS